MGNAARLSADEFRQGFEATQVLIREEWPALGTDALAATGGELDKVVELVAAQTEHTKAVIRRQLAELHQLGREGAAKKSQVDELLGALEGRADRVVSYLKGEALPKAESTIRNNLLASLLVAAGVGLLVGLLLRGFGRDR
jgi:ElaB/YqjD/DUF883 family membrane-anchored ribosome-binding protein